MFIDPGSPWQNAWIESFNGRLRDELLNGRQWDSLLEARVLIEDWRIDYNINRPHSAHGDLSPTESERVKGDETTSYADWMSASRLGLLIQATSGSFGGVGGRWRNRAGFAS